MNPLSMKDLRKTEKRRDLRVTPFFCNLNSYLSLLSLLAEDFHCYALAYRYYNGDQETIVSYYLQSIKWLYESLKFAENSPETQLEIMTSLKYRYNDIMTYSEPKSEEWLRAKLLSDAFDSLIDRGL